MTKEKLALAVIERLKQEYPDADCTLDYDQAWKLLVSVRLAAQCTDARVNVVVEDLYAKYPDIDALANATPEEIEEIVRPCGLGKSKARDINACMRMLRDEYHSQVPDDFNALLKLPGVGRRTALRLAIHILRMERDSVAEMTESIDRFRNEIRYCSQCNNLSDEEVCPICADRERDHATICVVEQVADVLSVENTRQYRGMYHVLGGVISPMQGISPSDLKIDLLCERIARGGVKEVILAISTSVEGETTLFYLMNRLRQFPGLKVTSIARGIGFGDELEYVDELTITHALMNRREIE